MGIVVVKKPKLKSVDPVLRRAVEVLIAQEKLEEEEAAKKKKKKKKSEAAKKGFVGAMGRFPFVGKDKKKKPEAAKRKRTR